MTAATLTLADFVLARIAEDEAVVTQPFGSWSQRGHAFEWAEVGAISEVLVVGEDRVLAECAVKRAIVDMADEATGLDLTVDNERRTATRDLRLEPYLGDQMLKTLASVYADHPDFDPSWR